MQFKSWFIVALAGLLLVAPVSSADDAVRPEKQLIASKAGSIVWVEYVLQISFNMGGQTREQEQNGRAIGVVVDEAGLVMVPSGALDVQVRGGRRGGRIQATSTPTNIRVVFPGDENEYPAIIGAKDTKLGLAFVLIKDLGEKTCKGLDTSKVADAEVGETLFGISRLDQGFDHAPFCGRVRVTGQVESPRKMWIIDDGRAFLALPLFKADGTLAGVCSIQSGVGSSTSTRPFLLPLETVRSLVGRAKKEAQRSLEEILEAEEEAADEADEDADGEGDEGDEGDEGGEGGGDEGDGD